MHMDPGNHRRWPIMVLGLPPRRRIVALRSVSICALWVFWNVLVDQSLAWIQPKVPWDHPRRDNHATKLPNGYCGLLPSSLRDSGNDDDDDYDGDESEASLIRYRGRVCYDGSSFQGFQIQLGRKDAPTIQGALEDVLQRRFNRSTIRVVGAGRTDAGVSARGQAFHFDLAREEHASLQKLKHNKPLPPLDYVMNRMLQYEIRVYHVGRAPPPREKTLEMTGDPDSEEFSTERESQSTWTKTAMSSTLNKTIRFFAWNAIHGATRKLYSYRICVGPVMDPLYRFQRWQVPGDGKLVNITKLQKALAMYEGTHDFRAFAGSVEQTERKANRTVNSVRTIHHCQLVDDSDLYGGRVGFYRIDIILSGALYKMVRNMVGAAIDVSRGRLDEATFRGLIQQQPSSDAGISDGGQQQLVRKDNKSKPAPPEGLTLEWVYYDDDADDGF